MTTQEGVKAGRQGARAASGARSLLQRNRDRKTKSLRMNPVSALAPPLDAATGQAAAEASHRFGYDFARMRVNGAGTRSTAAGRTGGGGPPPAASPAAPAAESAAPAVSAAPETTTEPAGATAGVGVAAGLSWSHVLRFSHDALWWFCGEHPSGFSTNAHLRAAGFSNPASLRWRITRGTDKVAFRGSTAGERVVIDSRAGSARANDVSIEVREGASTGAPSYRGNLTVRKPHRLIHRSTTDHGTCPPWSTACTAPVFWSEIGYRVVDNVGGTIVGATVNENFPGTKTNDQPNNWENPSAFVTSSNWPNTNGTFIDNWFHWGGSPAPVAPTAPGSAASVDRMPHEFYVGTTTPGRGCRVQAHTAHRYLGFARHEGIRTPAP